MRPSQSLLSRPHSHMPASGWRTAGAADRQGTAASIAPVLELAMPSSLTCTRCALDADACSDERIMPAHACSPTPQLFLCVHPSAAHAPQIWVKAASTAWSSGRVSVSSSHSCNLVRAVMRLLKGSHRGPGADSLARPGKATCSLAAWIWCLWSPWNS